jgi:prepilin-type N-terminal cleavage/methylation domain-containing protein
MKPSASRGFTLVEIAIALTLTGLLVAVVGSLFVASLSTWRRGQDLREAQTQASTLTDVIARDVRNASQAPSVLIHPAFSVGEGEPVIAITAAATQGSGAAWILYVHVVERKEVVRHVITADADGRVRVNQSRVVATGVSSITAHETGGGVTVEVEVGRGLASAQSRTTSTPRNP